MHIFGFELLSKKSRSLPGIDGNAAGKDVHRSVPVLGPGMYGQMRLGNHYDARNSLRVEILKRGLQDGRAGDLGRLGHNFFQVIEVVYLLSVARPKLDQKMSTQRSHSHPPYRVGCAPLVNKV